MSNDERPADYPSELPWPYQAPKKKIQEWTVAERGLHNKYVGWKRRGTTRKAEIKKARRERGTKNMLVAHETGATKLGVRAANFNRWMAQRNITNDLRKAGENLTQAYFEKNKAKVWACLETMADYATKGFAVIPEVDQHGHFIYVNDDDEECGPNDPGARIKERILRVSDDASHRGAIMAFLERIIGAPGKNINIKQDVHFSASLKGTLEDAKRFKDEANKRFVENVARPVLEAGSDASEQIIADRLDALRADGSGPAQVPEQPDDMPGNGPDDSEGDDREH